MGSRGSRPVAAGLLLLVFDLGVFVSGALPARVGDWICRRGGDLAFYALSTRRRITAENMARVTGRQSRDPIVQRLVRESFRNYGSYMYETVRYSHIATEEMLGRVNVHDEHHLTQARERGKGVIFVAAHFGSLEVGAVTVANRIAPMTIPGTPLEPKKLMDKLIRQRAAKGVRLSVYDGAARDVLVALKNNESVGFVVDLGASWEGNGKTMVDFFGRPAPFPAGVALLALRTGAAIVPGYALTRPDGKVDGYALPAIIPESTGDKDADARECMQRVARALEVFIARNPEQWYMFRPMWPSGAMDHAGVAPARDPGPAA